MVSTKTTTPTTPNGLPIKGSAGPKILKDLGLNDAALAAFLPPGAPHVVRGVFWCRFEGPPSLDAIAAHFSGRFDVSRTVGKKMPPGGPPDGYDVPMVVVRPKGRYVAYLFYGMRGEVYVKDGSWQLEDCFHASGTGWGSNRAVYERFKAVELAALGARNVLERTE